MLSQMEFPRLVCEPPWYHGSTRDNNHISIYSFRISGFVSVEAGVWCLSCKYTSNSVYDLSDIFPNLLIMISLGRFIKQGREINTF